MGACLSKCGGKYFVRKEDKKEDGGDTPKLVNKVEHNASFKEADKKNGEANGAAAANGKTRKDSSSSSSNSEAGEAEDKVRSKRIYSDQQCQKLLTLDFQVVKLLEKEPENALQPNMVTSTSVTSSSQMTSASEETTVQGAEDGSGVKKTITVQQETTQKVLTSTSEQVDRERERNRD